MIFLSLRACEKQSPHLQGGCFLTGCFAIRERGGAADPVPFL
jgi:hypothetical protein